MISDEIDLRAHCPRIDTNDYFDLRSWAKRFGVTAGEVRRAVTRVGDRPKDVETYLDFTRESAATELRNAGR